MIGVLISADTPASIYMLVAAGLYVLHGERSRARAELEPIAD